MLEWNLVLFRTHEWCREREWESLSVEVQQLPEYLGVYLGDSVSILYRSNEYRVCKESKRFLPSPGGLACILKSW